MTMLAPQPVETSTQSPLGTAVPVTRHPFALSPLNRRRWQNFKANRRGYWSFWIFMVLFVVSTGWGAVIVIRPHAPRSRSAGRSTYR